MVTRGGCKLTDSKFYKEMVNILHEKECSIRQLAKECGVSYLTFIQFFNPTYKFKPVSIKTQGKIHNHLGISYDVMEEYNEMVLKERGV